MADLTQTGPLYAASMHGYLQPDTRVEVTQPQEGVPFVLRFGVFGVTVNLRAERAELARLRDILTAALDQHDKKEAGS